MNRIKIGIVLESLELPFRQALSEAQRLEVTGVEFSAAGALRPSQLSETARREVRHLLSAHNQEAVAVGCTIWGGLGTPESQEARLDYVKDVMSLSFDLGPRLAVVQAGKAPDPKEDPGIFKEALTVLGAHGDRIGATLALETGLESGETLCQLLDQIDSGSLAVCYDPANLLINGQSPYDSARALHRRIRHIHAKDARKSAANRAAQEIALGHGDLDWMYLAELLAELEYQGWVCVQRDSGSQRRADVGSGVGFLRRIFG
jgi:sugar phosphate isomerase/epimerase